MALAQEYREIVDEQAPDWSDLFFSLELLDEAQLDEARLAMAPAQLERVPGTANRFTFHVSQTRGYGCHAPLAQSCLAKLDQYGITATLLLEQAYHAVDANWTQGPTY